MSKARLAEVEDLIEDIYRKAYKVSPNIRLDSDKGILGQLWAEFDWLMSGGK